MKEFTNSENNIQSTLFGDGNKNTIVDKPSYEEDDISVTYDKSPCALNDHFWRDAYLKNSINTRHVVYCTHCSRVKFNDDGSVQDWLLEQGYVRDRDRSDEQVTDYGYGKI